MDELHLLENCRLPRLSSSEKKHLRGWKGRTRTKQGVGVEPKRSEGVEREGWEEVSEGLNWGKERS